MIREKMEMSCLIRSLNELEKLKLLLFDDNQLFLFEHIPRPWLVDCGDGGKSGSEENGADKKNMLMLNNKGFW
jgi:hypothetical protein